MKTPLYLKLMTLLLACNFSGLSNAMDEVPLESDGKRYKKDNNSADAAATVETIPQVIGEIPADRASAEPSLKRQKPDAPEANLDDHDNPGETQNLFAVGHVEALLKKEGCLNKILPGDVLRIILKHIEGVDFFNISDVCQYWRRAAEGHFILPSDLEEMHNFMTSGIRTQGFTQKLLEMVGRDKLGLKKLENYWKSYFDKPLQERLFRSRVNKSSIILTLNPSFGTYVKNPYKGKKLLHEHSEVWAPYALAMAVAYRFGDLHIDISGLAALWTKKIKDEERLKELLFPYFTFPASGEKGKWVWNSKTWDECAFSNLFDESNPVFLPTAISTHLQLKLAAKEMSEGYKKRYEIVKTRLLHDGDAAFRAGLTTTDKALKAEYFVQSFRHRVRALTMLGPEATAQLIEQTGDAAYCAGLTTTDIALKAEYFVQSYRHCVRALTMLGDKATAILIGKTGDAAYNAGLTTTDIALKAEYFVQSYRHFIQTLRMLGDKATAQQIGKTGDAAFHAGLTSTDKAQKVEYFAVSFQLFDKVVALYPEHLKTVIETAIKNAEKVADPDLKTIFESKVREYQSKMPNQGFPG